MYSERSKDKALRVPVISFSIKGRSSKEVVEKVDGMSNFGIRWGHFYSKRLVDEVLGLGEEGVVRVSIVHYNTGMFLFLSCCFCCRSDLVGLGSLAEVE